MPSFLWQFFNGAYGELLEVDNWLEVGNMSPDDVVSAFIDAFDSMGECCMIGAIMPFMRDVLPNNCLPCDGGHYLRVDYPLLYEVLPGALIVDADTFLTPDLTAVFLIGEGNGRSMLDTGGEEAHTLTVSEMPEHTHDYTAAAASVATVVAPNDPSAIPSPSVSSPAGGGQPHNNMPPYVVVKYGIVAK
ncbi:MAG: tail fiber protein [Ardenticatenaceae bacterium]|nr:tail fiber protein [Ardenticatenaceae bacterium]